MRLHISLDDDLVRELDRAGGRRGRSRAIAAAVLAWLEHRRRLEALDRAIGSIPDTGHDWDADPASWVHEQRFADPRRVG